MSIPKAANQRFDFAYKTLYIVYSLLLKQYTFCHILITGDIPIGGWSGPSSLACARGPRHFRNFCNIFLPNVEDQKSLII